MMSSTNARPLPPPPRTWDARLARRLVTPLADTRVTPNHLTTVRLAVGLAGAACFVPGTFAWTNAGALLVVLSNFIDHTDGELARISGKTSAFGHAYDLASDALITVLLFACVGAGVSAAGGAPSQFPLACGIVAGLAVAFVFSLRLRIEAAAGKAGTQQASFAGFETEDVLYLLPLVTLTGVLPQFLVAAAIGAPLFAAVVMVDWLRRGRP